MKKNYLIIFICMFLLGFICVPQRVLAKENSDYTKQLIEGGYTKETLEVLPAETQMEMGRILIESPEKISITRVTLEVDILTEIEELFSYSEEEHAEMGADIPVIIQEKQRFEEYCKMTDSELAKLLDIDEQEAKMIKKAVANGRESLKNNISRVKKAGVNASGYISSSDLYYVQTVTDQSNTNTPLCEVILSYSWDHAYITYGYRDKIVATWGGELNTKNISSVARYYHWTSIGSDYGEKYSQNSMESDITPQSAIEFDFAQEGSALRVQNKSGYAKFQLYQTVGEGKETTVVSRYCHKVQKAGDYVTISYPPSIEVGPAYDVTSQSSSIIRY